MLSLQKILLRLQKQAVAAVAVVVALPRLTHETAGVMWECKIYLPFIFI